MLISKGDQLLNEKKIWQKCKLLSLEHQHYLGILEEHFSATLEYKGEEVVNGHGATLATWKRKQHTTSYKPIKPNVATLALGSRPRQGLVRLRAKREARGSDLMLLGVQRVWRNEPSHSQVNSHFGSWSPNGLSNFQKAIAGVEPIGLKNYLCHWKYIEMYMFKMGSHDSFGHLKHKLWPKERPGVKLSI
jgi:hypothetical protein